MANMYTQDEVSELCAQFIEDLKVEYGDDLEKSDDGLSASIQYYSHGRWCTHDIDLEMMAKTALIYARQ